MTTEDIVKIRLTMDVAYTPNGVWPTDLKYNLEDMCMRAIGEGMLTNGLAAEVDSYTVRAVIVGSGK